MNKIDTTNYGILSINSSSISYPPLWLF